MTIAIYIVWFLIPLCFFLMALWSFLEALSGKGSSHAAIDLSRQGLFLFACVLASIALDYYVLPVLVDSLSFDFIPYEIFQFV